MEAKKDKRKNESEKKSGIKKAMKDSKKLQNQSEGYEKMQ